MKKMIFSAAAFAVVAVSTAVVAPTTSEAIPAFARQTGAACLSCHFQSFPTLAPMGRSFKEGAFTDMGEQGLIEDDMLSITNAVNITMVLRPQFTSTTTTGAASTKVASIADQVIMFGGRVGTNTGTFVEYDGTFANFQLLSSMDLGDAKVGIDFFNAGFGVTSGMEVGSTYGQHGGMLNGKNLTAFGALSGNNNAEAGVTVFYANDLVNASIGLVTDSAAFDGKVDNGWKLAPMARVFFHAEVGDFELGLGGMIISGKTGNQATNDALALAGAARFVISTAVAPLVPTTEAELRKWALDFQAQGEVGDMQVGVYADYAKASADSGSKVNMFSKLGGESSGYSLRANIKPLHNVIIGGGFGIMRDSTVANVETKTAQIQLAAEYEIYQNFVVALIYNSTSTTTGGTKVKVKTTTLDIEALL